MSRGLPSMTALLGMLALAGYQNRDKIGEFLNGLNSQPAQGSQQSGLGGVLGSLGGVLGGGGAGGLLSGGLSELLNRFNGAGYGEAA